MNHKVIARRISPRGSWWRAVVITVDSEGYETHREYTGFRTAWEARAKADSIPAEFAE